MGKLLSEILLQPSYLLRFRGRPCEKLPAFRPKPAQDFGPAKEKDPPVVVDLKPLNPGGQTSVILPKASIKKQKHLKSIMMNRKGTGTDSAEPQEYDARLLRVDCHGWFYLRKITRNNVRCLSAHLKLYMIITHFILHLVPLGRL